MPLVLDSLLQRLRACGRQALASECAVCRSWPAHTLCQACITRFATSGPRCPTCALALPQDGRRCGACLTAPQGLDRCLAAVPYDYPWVQCLARFKFRQEPGWAGSLAQLLLRTPQVDMALQAADLVLPIPLSRERLQERGYNQSQLLAQRLCAAKTRTDLLLRVRHTPPQSGLPLAERRLNLRRALAVDPLQTAQLQGRTVVLVDDVMTTGTTLFTAAAVLRAAGVQHVTALVLARTAQ